MRYNYNIRMHALLVFSFLIFLSSCAKFVEIDPPSGKVESNRLFADKNAAIAAASGIYASMLTSTLQMTNGGATLYGGLSADEMVYTSTNEELLAFQNNTLIPTYSTSLYSRLWSSAYKTVYNTNSVLEGLSVSESIPDSLRKQLTGEMLTIRALNYFYLINFFGDIPFQTSTDYRVNSLMQRTTAGNILDSLITDLELAKQLMKDNYPSVSKARPNKWVATALLARLCLYAKKWDKAAENASLVINSGKYQLEPDPSNVFNISSKETLWQLSSDYRNTAEGTTFVPASSTARPAYAISTFLLEAFSTDDKRKNQWMKSSISGGATYFYPFKYRIRVSTPITEYYVVLRLAEQYLIKAEAKAMLNDNNAAINDLNTIRQRAGIENVVIPDRQSLAELILTERQKELFCEWSHRFFDLKRTGKADAILGRLKAPNWQATDVLYPIPQSELDINPSLVQNPGY